MAATFTSPIDARPKGRASGFWQRLWQRLKTGDDITYTITLVCAITILTITALVVFELWTHSEASRHKFGWGFLTGTNWDPVAEDYGALPFVYGTVVTSALGLLLAVPLGVGAAIFLAELAPAKISNLLTFLIELLAAVPSVIFGLLGIFVLVPFLKQTVPALQAVLGWTPLFAGSFNGFSVFSAGIVLVMMIIPFIISISREVIMAVPNEQREGALALGATRWETTFDVVLPSARNGILGSIFLALARSLGETMAVTMVIGNEPAIHASLLDHGATIASQIASEFGQSAADVVPRATLIELGLVLFGLTIIVNGVARLLVMSTSRKGA